MSCVKQSTVQYKPSDVQLS